MKKLSANDTRALFLNYFEQKGHTVVSSSPLVPKSDPSLLFTNAGMVQFKGVFLGSEKREFVRAASSQKCFRASGKHNDLENVGYTARHHTFFEMLGNFSFGDYFKEEAIALGWDFLINYVGIVAEKLWVTVYEEDDEAERIWHQHIGVPLNRIVRMGKKDNFWAMGESGPCGPCSEIIYDQGPDLSCGRPGCAVGCDCDRYLELWNLVFMQFNQDEKGVRTPLPKPSIDTGMGLERISAVIQGVSSNYEIDLLRSIIVFLEDLAEKKYGEESSQDISMRVIADHSRAVAFLITDGVLPSNEGRGYVLRRVIRRALRHGRKLGLTGPFLYRTTGVVADTMRDAYPELANARNLVAQAVKNEEERFLDTLEIGLRLLQEEVEKAQAARLSHLRGPVVFKLYDTFGFPLDLTADVLREVGMGVDEDGFNTAMSAQRTKAREAWKGSGEEEVGKVYQNLTQEGVRTSFTGYESLEGKSRIERILHGGRVVQELSGNDEAEVITPETPFYGETGGQTGDRGRMAGDRWKAEVLDTLRPLPEIIVHKVRVLEGTMRTGDAVSLSVDVKRRMAIAANHTATHILQAVLREVLGDHVHQEGSLVTSERFRFDFTHFSPLTERELTRIEELVNEKIRENAPVKVGLYALEDALKQNVMALFGEKYGDTVRMVEVGEYSKELCGGTHAHQTGEIGFLKLLHETGVAAGVRRIEAVTGQGAWQYLRTCQEEIEELESLLKTPRADLVRRVRKLLEEERNLQREVEKLKDQVARSHSRDLLEDVKIIEGIRVLAAQVQGVDPKTLRTFGDTLRERMGTGILVLGAVDGDKALLLVMVSQDLTARFSAGEIIKHLAPLVGGRGGGRSDMAQAGGKFTDKLEEALNQAYAVISGMV